MRLSGSSPRDCIDLYGMHADGPEEGTLRLRGQTETGDQVSGVLEIFHAGAWGTVCDGGFNFVEVVSEFTYYVDDYYSGLNPVRFRAIAQTHPS